MTDTPVISNTRADAAALVDLRYEDVDQPGRLVQTTTNRPCGRTMLLPGATFREFFWSADDGRRLRVLVDAVTWIPSRFSVPTAGLSFDYADKACEYDDHHRMTSCELINVDPFDIAVHPGIYVLSAGESGYFVTAIRWGAPATIIPARSRAPIKIDPEAVDQVRDLSAGRGYAYGPDWDIALEQPDFPVPEGP